MPGTTEADVSSAVALLRDGGVAAAAYRMLDEAVARHHASDAWMVLHPPGRGPQIFRVGRRAVPLDAAAHLAGRPTGLYVDVPSDTSAYTVLATLFEVAFQAEAAAREAAVDAGTGLASRRSMEAAVVRAAACGARYAWSTSAVLLTTAGPRPPGERWSSLAAALRRAVRSGDEAGVAGDGVALALLGAHAGSDAVRPFLARVRAELSAIGGDEVGLLAAAVSTPADSVDPSELWRLAAERLAGLGIDADIAAAAVPDELDLRSTPGVVCVGLGDGARLVSVSWSQAALDGAALDGAAHVADDEGSGTAGAHQPGHGGRDGDAPAMAGRAMGPLTTASVSPSASANGGPSVTNGNGSHGHIEDCHQASDSGHLAPLVSATAAGEADAERTLGSRIEVLSVRFDSERGVSEVSLSRNGVRSSGRAPAGPLAGGAQATLLALGALGLDLPFYLVSAERVRSVPGDPVIVMLAPRSSRQAAGADELIGIARGQDDVDVASRATLNALNRFLSRAIPSA